MSKPTGLAAFTRKGATSAQQHPSETRQGEEPITETRQRGRGKGNVVALTVRLSRADWERVHQLAVAEGVSIQALAIDGLSKVFTEKGLPSLNT